MESYVCCFCGKTFNDWGNNPYPACKDENARCCDDCNNEVVLPARILAMSRNKEG